MRKFVIALAIIAILASCNSSVKEAAGEPTVNVDSIFQANSQTVLANLKGWQEENLDYSMYSDDFIMLDSGFNAPEDSISKSQMMEMDKMMWAMFDFEMLNEPQLLPGVNSDTKEPDGSVRHYSGWKVTRVATDSTEAKSGNIRLYESFDFDENGKINFQQVYGDFAGLMNYLMQN